MAVLKEIERMQVLLIFAFLFLFSGSSVAVKVRDEVEVESFRVNYLTGYGIVVGLNRTGDGMMSRYTLMSIANMLRNFGVFIDPAQVMTRNAAAVIVTANLPPFAKPGMTFDVNVASVGDARDIGNGVLVRTPLYGPDGKIYAFAQGPVSTGGGFLESNKTGKVQKGFPTAGVVVNGGIVEEELPFDFNSLESVKLNLRSPDFKKATEIAESINRKYPSIARVVDPSTVVVSFPQNTERSSLLADILNIDISTDNIPTIVIYERTGTVILSGDIRIDPPVYVSHGNIYVMVETVPVVSQPPALSGGQTVVTQQTQTRVVQEKGRIIPIESASVRDLVKALNDLGVSPYDLIAILQAIKNAGKLHANIKVM